MNTQLTTEDYRTIDVLTKMNLELISQAWEEPVEKIREYLENKIDPNNTKTPGELITALKKVTDQISMDVFK